MTRASCCQEMRPRWPSCSRPMGNGQAAPVDKYQRRQIVKTVITGRPFGEWRAAEITRELVEALRRQRPTVAGNRDLALLRAMFNWAVLGELVPSTPFKGARWPR